ncbi:MAG: hypothetical protein LKG27_02775 [Clostridiaceae bacterium]|jgi:hypothetical protein|nr:hypothetical protein [Clostridiaceae bacterium]
MTIQPIQTALNQRQNTKQGHPSFTGFNPVISLMDSIERGGYIASFVSQDCVGMVAPRIYEGANRNKDKTGKYNWAFARREALRELLSGPSMFVIPLALFGAMNKKGWTANKVPVDRINVLGEKFARYAEDNKDLIKSDSAAAKKGFYNEVFRDLLTKTTEQKVSETDIEKLAQDYTDRYIQIENSKSKGFIKKLMGKEVKGSSEDLLQELADDFMTLKKQNLSPSNNLSVASISEEANDSKATGGFKSMLGSLSDFTNDAMRSTKKALEHSTELNIADYARSFAKRRMGSRILSNAGIFGAVVLFMTQIPKLYNMGLKGNPGLDGLDTPEGQKKAQGKNQPNFTGKGSVLEKTADIVTKKSWLKQLSDKFEFNGASMTPTQCLTLLFGFCLPPRLMHANDKHDRKEIYVRDVSSFVAILFAAKGLARGFSDIMAKASGLALNIKPDNFNKSPFHKIYSYATSGDGVHVLQTGEIVSKYSHIDKFKGGINGFFSFLKENGGNVRKALSLDKTVKENAEKIVGKSIKDASIEEIEYAFKNNKNTEALENIYKVFKDANNTYVRRAKTMNSTFGFLSTLVIVPAFMIWLAKFCEKMTKNDIAAEKAQNEQDQNAISKADKDMADKQTRTLMTKQPTMEGFLAK